MMLLSGTGDWRTKDLAKQQKNTAQSKAFCCCRSSLSIFVAKHQYFANSCPSTSCSAFHIFPFQKKNLSFFIDDTEFHIIFHTILDPLNLTQSSSRQSWRASLCSRKTKSCVQVLPMLLVHVAECQCYFPACHNSHQL